MNAAIRKINALEGHIVKAEDDADAMLWEQARQVVALLKKMSQRDIAKQWLNVRGEPYSQSHVVWTKRTFEQHANQQSRPRFREAYNKVAHARPSREVEQPLAFHWMNAADDLHRLCAREAATWPLEAQPLLPQLLREIADRFERDHDVSRGHRAEGTSPGSNPRVHRHDSTAA